MEDSAIMCLDFVNALNMLICSVKHPASRGNYGYTKKVIIDRWATIQTLSAEQFSTNLDI